MDKNLFVQSYERLLEETTNEEVKKAIQMQIDATKSVCNKTANEICAMYDTSYFNDITSAYAKRAMTNVGISNDDINSVLEEIKWLHDTVSAKEIIEG